MDKELVYVAKLGKTVGLKGDLKLYIDSDFPEQIKNNAAFTTNKKLQLTIENYDAKKELVKFKGIDTVEDAKKLVNQQLLSSVEQTRQNCELKENQYFWFDLIGCSIIEKNSVLGRVKEIHRYPVDDYLEIATDKEYIEKNYPKSFLIPYNDNFILSVSLENKEIMAKGAFDILENS
jgi:16S rRNA processing protein RimM